MFTDFQRVWTPVLLQRRLGKKPIPVQIAGEKLVLFRDQNGIPGALLDRCPHRGVALSLGRRTNFGTLQCGFHGWEFDTLGQCTHVPFNFEAKRTRLGVLAFPVHEGGGLIWLYTGLPAETMGLPDIPPCLQGATPNLFALEVTWQTHWTRVQENMMDGAHVPFVHKRTLGRILSRTLRRDSTLDVTCSPTQTGLYITGVQDKQHIVGLHEFHRPNGMVLYVDGQPRSNLRIVVYCIPVHATATRLLVLGHFGRASNWLAQLFLPLNRFIVQEDKAIVESSLPPEVPPPGQESCVATDRGTLSFRKYYYDVLKDKPAKASVPALRLAAD